MKTILLDLDGVLTNFVSGVESRLGPIPEGQGDNWEISSWYGMEPEHFWPQVSDALFWLTLPEYSDGKLLLKEIISADIPFYFCSTPTLSPGSVAGKLQWIQRFYPEYSRNYIFTPAKHLLAKPENFLIDDNEKNCDDFVAAGGKANLWPRPWNSKAEAETTKVKERISTIIQYAKEN